MDNSVDTVSCLNCNKVIAVYDKDEMKPSAEESYKAGNVAVPNFGWFCSQECATQFEQDNNVKFSRNAQGLVDYYGKLS